MTEIVTAGTGTLAAGLFDSGTDLGIKVLVFLSVLALVVGTVSAFRKLREGAGTAITEEILVCVFASIILLSVGITSAFTREANDAGIRSPVPVNTGIYGR
jgi:hypothetical protein